MVDCKYCKCVLSVYEMENYHDMCVSCHKAKQSGKKWFGNYYGWLTREEAEVLKFKWEDGK